MVGAYYPTREKRTRQDSEEDIRPQKVARRESASVRENWIGLFEEEERRHQERREQEEQWRKERDEERSWWQREMKEERESWKQDREEERETNRKMTAMLMDNYSAIVELAKQLCEKRKE